MDERSHTPIRIKRLTGKTPGDHWFCEVCCVKWPCLQASQIAARQARKRGDFVPSSVLQPDPGQT